MSATPLQPLELAGRPAASPLWITLATLLGLALLAYLPAALGAHFLGFDDVFYFGPQNPEFRAGLGAVLDPRHPIANVYLPVAHASLYLDYALFGDAPFGPHLHAILLHGLVAVVFVRLLLALGLAPFAAHVAGALFVLHPALAESVAWVASRKDLLAGLFVFAALHQTVRFAARPSRGRGVFLALLAALAMYSKATAVVLPLLAGVVCLYTGGSRRRWLAPLVLALVTAPIAWHHQVLAAAEGTMAEGSSMARLAQVPGALWHYVAVTFWPVGLNVLYPEVATLERFRAALATAGPLLAGALVLVIVGWLRPRWRLAALGGAAFFVALLPFNTAFPASSIAAADRYLYLAVPFAALASVAILQRLAGARGPAVLAVLAVALAYWCGSRAHDFRDDQSLWGASLAVDDDNAVAHFNFVFDQLQRGPAELAGVKGHLEAAVRCARYPVHALRAERLLATIAMREADYPAAARHARGAVAAAKAQLARETSPQRRAQAEQLLLEAQLAAFEPLRQAGETAEAEADFAAAQRALPDHPDVIAAAALRDLATSLAELRQRTAPGPRSLAADDPRGVAADAALTAALAAHPQHAGLACAQAAWDTARDRVLSALKFYRQAQAADPDCIDAWLGAARLLRERGQYADAEDYARRGLAQRPDPSLRQELALALVGQLRLDDAIQQLEACLRTRPDDKDLAKVLANVLVGKAYTRLDQPDSKRSEIEALVQRALAYNPNEGKAHLVLGRIARERRQFKLSAEHFAMACKLVPDFPDARRFYAESLADLGMERMLAKDDEGAGEAWAKCLEAAPPDFERQGIELQVKGAWRRLEARGVERRKAGDTAGAIADFRRCLTLDPKQLWAAWLLASTIHDQPDVDLAELEDLCRKAMAWQIANGLDRSQQVYLLARTLARRGDAEGARTLVRDYLAAPDAEAKPQVLAALHQLAGE